MSTWDVRLKGHMEQLIRRYPALEACEADILEAYRLMQTVYEHGGKLLVAGNGGSAADSEHIVGELMKRFKISRPVSPDFAQKLAAADPIRGPQLAQSLERSLMAIPLVTHEALTTAFLNDANAVDVYAQQLFGYGRPGDVFLGISTSGNSENILRCVVVAKAVGIHTIGLTGQSGGKLAEVCDVTVRVPETETFRIQEYHLPVYHAWCLMLEDYFFGSRSRVGGAAPHGTGKN